MTDVDLHCNHLLEYTLIGLNLFGAIGAEWLKSPNYVRAKFDFFELRQIDFVIPLFFVKTSSPYFISYFIEV